MARFLMCRPDHFGIHYEINPWMKIQRPADSGLALQQWERLVEVLTRDMGAEIALVDAAPGLPDMCFTANAGYVCDGAVVPSRFRHYERRREEPHFLRWFRENGLEVRTMPEGPPFEGAGDALTCAGRIFAGYHYRTDVRAHAMLGEAFGFPVVSLQLVDRRFYHVDTCFCPLDENRALYYPPAFDDYATRALAAHIPELIAVGPDDALHFGCNAVVVGDSVALNEPCSRLSGQLEELGYAVHAVSLGEFVKAGGSAKCLTLRLDHSCPI